jgi:hypothetical protein
MGKRELLLVVGFIVLGAVVYHATAPPSGADRRSAWSELMDHIRREVRGNRGSAEITETVSHRVTASTSEVRLNTSVPDLTIVGENRTDVVTEHTVRSNGMDDAEAKKLAGETKLVASEAGGSLVLSITYPQPGSQRSALTLRVPSRLRVHIGRSTQRQQISGIASLEGMDIRGETTISKIPGRVALTHRGGTLKISDVGALKLTSRGSDSRLEQIRGEMTLQLNAGELRGSELAGPFEVDANGTEVTLENLEKTRGPIRINGVNGRVILRGLATDARVDGRNTEIEAVVERPAQIAIYADGEDIDVTPPAAGYELDAMTTDGHLEVSDGSLEVATHEKEQRVSGAVRGGGPMLTVRATRGDIRVRGRDKEKTAQEKTAQEKTPTDAAK